MSCKRYVLNAIFSRGLFECLRQSSSVTRILSFADLCLLARLEYLAPPCTCFRTRSLLGCFFHQSTDRTALFQKSLTSGLNFLNTMYY